LQELKSIFNDVGIEDDVDILNIQKDLINSNATDFLEFTEDEIKLLIENLGKFAGNKYYE
jgi:hypothetical protein